mmetsp:Transcript_59696/g.129300  ORF Transcript_59696/g.129300 Transcript_59696/m.129300 type:complete len:344 (-) Transcript_59696:880-1911(-)
MLSVGMSVCGGKIKAGLSEPQLRTNLVVVSEEGLELPVGNRSVLVCVDVHETLSVDVFGDLTMTLMKLDEIFKHQAQLLLVQSATVIAIIATPKFTEFFLVERLEVELAQELLPRHQARRLAQVLYRLHLDEAARSSIPRKDLVGHRGLLLILRDCKERDGVQGRCADKFGVALVESVNQRDEATHLVTLLQRQLRDIGQENGVEGVGDCQVVGGPEGFVTEVLEAEPGHLRISGHLRNHQSSALGLHLITTNDIPLAQAVELPFQQFFGITVVGVDVHTFVLLLALVHKPVVGLGGNVMHLAEASHHWDEGEEERAVEAVEVEILWRAIGRGHDHGAPLKQY